MSGTALQGNVDRVEPRRISVGRGSLVYVDGWCFHPRKRVVDVAIAVAGSFGRAVAYPFARADVTGELGPRAIDSGFCAWVELTPDTPPGEHPVELRATLANGTVESLHCGTLVVEAGLAEPLDVPALVGKVSGEPLIAICMATYNPPERLFERQIESIRQQTYARFVCIVADDGSEPHALARIARACSADPRFVLARGSERLGFYRNFERCLSLVPREATFVALSDHDDRWHPDKLAELRAALDRGEARLAYADMNIVTEEGRLLAPTYWSTRKNNYTRLAWLVIANTVTGAASLFRRDLLEDVLPFPPNVGHPYHDHWIACVALALGEIVYVDRPLHDYVQHGENVIGHWSPAVAVARQLRSRLSRLAPRQVRRTTRDALRQARYIYFADVVRLELLARTLELRLGGRMSSRSAATVGRLTRLDTSPGSLTWLLGRSARATRHPEETLGADWQLAKGVIWKHGQKARARGRSAVTRR